MDNTKQININNFDNVLKRIKLHFSCWLSWILYVSQDSLHIKPNLFKIGEIEKMIRCLFSIDKNSKTYIIKFQKFDSKYEKQLVPFAELELGDLLCFDRNTNEIVYYDHEQDATAKIADNWEQLSAILY